MSKKIYFYTVTQDLMKNKNKVILKANISYIKNAERFSGFLFD